MKKLRVLLCTLLCTLCLYPALERPVQAASVNDFVVKAVIPENQADRRKSYFDLLVEPGAQQTLRLSVENPGPREITVRTSLNNATTSQDGLVIYSQGGVRDESMAVSMEEIAQVLKPEIAVKPGETAMVDILLQVPEEDFPGIVLGGLNVSATDGTEPGEEGEQISLNHEYVYTIGLQISSTGEPMEPELHLVSIEPGVVNYRTAVTATIRNSEAVLMKGMTLSAKVYKRSGSTPIQESSWSYAEMAPNSTGDFIIDWEGQALSPGSYRLALRAEHKGRVWEWDEPFSISSGDASGANDGAVNVHSSRTWTFLLWGMFLICLAAMLAYRIGRRSARNRYVR